MARITLKEIARKAVHIGMGGFAFALHHLTWQQACACALAAFLFNRFVLSRIGGRHLWRGVDRERGYPFGILVYPLAIAALILAFRHDLSLVAAVWSMIAFGDGLASLAGQLWGGPRLPWNPAKSWTGFAAFVVCGSLGAIATMGYVRGLELATWPALLALTVPLALCCALVESLPTTLDDNLTVPLIGGLFLAMLTIVTPGALLARPMTLVLAGLGVNLLFALLAYVAHSIDVWGALSAVLIGTLIVWGLGWPGFAVMMAFFVFGSAVTKLGYAIKASRGIAQEKGGARGWRNAWANGGVPALLALAAGAAVPEWRVALVLAYVASIATAAADTGSSEVGKAYGRRTFLITTLRPVPPGTEGAISLEGTLGGLGVAWLVSLIAALCGLIPYSLAWLPALAGLIGSLVESVMGTVAEKKGWMDNDLLNAFNTAVGGGLALVLARAMLG
ncbi:MAG: DUF92 domain-containing protein [Vicinamibacteria bacterium]|jgi:uncharacterized protein (TIGR00297 family)|nr:DUF92 domain-containing protein [Vicinamibacteria bacterium]